LKILLLTHCLPYPPDKGDRIRAFYWLKSLSTIHEVDVLSLTHTDVSENDFCVLRHFAHQIWPVKTDRTNMFASAAAAFCNGTSITESFFSSKEFSRILGNIHQNYDRIIAVCSSVAAYLLNIDPVKPWIVDLVDVDSEKWNLYAQRHRGLQKRIFYRESRKVADLERRLASRAHCCVTVSGRECDRLRLVTPDVTSLAIPNGVDVDYFQPPDLPLPPNRLVFVGQMDYFPNVDAVCWFAENVWAELLGQNPALIWTIVGRNPVKSVRNLAKLPNVVVTGAVADVRPFLASAVSIAPIRISCGVQNKVLEAMAAGSPVVASPAVVDGLDVRPGQEILIADTPSDWRLSLEQIISDPRFALSLAGRAREAVSSRLTWNVVAEQMLRCVENPKNTCNDSGLSIDERENIRYK